MLVLMAKEETVLQGMTDKLIEIGRSYGTEMNVKKTKVMTISRQPSPVTSMIDQKQLLKQIIEGKIKGEIDVTRRRGRKRKKLLDDLKDRRGYSHLKEEAIDRTMWRNRFGRGVGPVVIQITE
jgi:hypothetical protein